MNKMTCPYDGCLMEFLASENDDAAGPGYWCPMCEKTFDEDGKPTLASVIADASKDKPEPLRYFELPTYPRND